MIDIRVNYLLYPHYKLLLKRYRTLSRDVESNDVNISQIHVDFVHIQNLHSQNPNQNHV